MKTDLFACTDPGGPHRMAYAEWGAASDRPTIICVHGLTRNGRDFDRLAEAFEKDGRHVICPDIVGRGKSDDLEGRPEHYTYAQYIADLMLFITARGLQQVDWVGTSMGGLIGMMIGSAKETPIRRLVINDVGPFLPLTALQRIGAYVSMRPEFADLQQLENYIRQIYAPFGITRDEDWKLLASNSWRTLPNGKLVLAHDPAIAQNFAKLDKDVDVWEIYDAITRPTLVLHGVLSDVLPADVAQQMTLRGPKARLIEYPGVGHAPGLMDKKQIDDVRGFLNYS